MTDSRVPRTRQHVGKQFVSRDCRARVPRTRQHVGKQFGLPRLSCAGSPYAPTRLLVRKRRAGRARPGPRFEPTPEERAPSSARRNGPRSANWLEPRVVRGGAPEGPSVEHEAPAIRRRRRGGRRSMSHAGDVPGRGTPGSRRVRRTGRITGDPGERDARRPSPDPPGSSNVGTNRMARGRKRRRRRRVGRVEGRDRPPLDSSGVPIGRGPAGRFAGRRAEFRAVIRGPLARGAAVAKRNFRGADGNDLTRRSNFRERIPLPGTRSSMPSRVVKPLS